MLTYYVYNDRSRDGKYQGEYTCLEISTWRNELEDISAGENEVSQQETVLPMGIAERTKCMVCMLVTDMDSLNTRMFATDLRAKVSTYLPLQ